MISAGSLGKITSVLLFGLTFVGVHLDPSIVSNGVQAGMAVASTLLYIISEIKKDIQTKEITAKVDATARAVDKKS